MAYRSKVFGRRRAREAKLQIVILVLFADARARTAVEREIEREI